jgi:PTS system sucrose-specific IIC component
MGSKDKRSIFEDTIDEFLLAVGGHDNLETVFNCASRLRFVVKNKELVDIQALKKVNLAKGLHINGDQYQLIFGPGTVNKVMDYYNKRLTPIAGKATTVHEIKANFFVRSKKEIKQIGFKGYSINTLRGAVRGFASIFIPLIPLFIIGGFSLATKALIQQFDANEVNAASGTGYVFY